MGTIEQAQQVIGFFHINRVELFLVPDKGRIVVIGEPFFRQVALVVTLTGLSFIFQISHAAWPEAAAATAHGYLKTIAIGKFNQLACNILAAVVDGFLTQIMVIFPVAFR